MLSDRCVRPLLLSAFVLLAALAVACGDDDPDGGSGSPTTAPETPAPTAAPATFGDPFDYCAAVGTIDRPDERYTGATVPADLVTKLEVVTGAPEGYLSGPAAPTPALFWRCMNGAVLACTPGANIPCYNADTSTEPRPEVLEYCRQNPDTFPPAAVTGHETVHVWQCEGQEPVIAATEELDERGFVTRYWFALEP